LSLWPLAPVGSRFNLKLDREGHSLKPGVEIIAPDVIRYVVWPAEYAPKCIHDKLAVYGPFIKEMESWGYEEKFIKDIESWGYEEKEDARALLIVFPYDWRLNNLIHAKALDVLVEKVLENRSEKKVVLIAHSMGGIVARAYMALARERGLPNRVDTFITMGTPHLGSPKVFYSLTMGYDFGNPTVNENLMKILCQNVSSAYQLLPRKPFVEQWTSGEKTDWTLPETYSVWYHSTKWIRPGVPYDVYETSEDWPWIMNPDLVRDAKELHDLIGETAPEGVKTFTIIGCGLPTLSKYHERRPRERDSKSYGLLKKERDTSTRIWFAPRFEDGDGTVPLWSAEGLLGDTKLYIQDSGKEDSAEHGALPSSERIQKLISNILKGDPVESEYKKKPFVIEESEKIKYTLHSSANLHIYDSEGNHMGLNDFGAIDEGIPGGTFLRMDDKEFAVIFNALDSYQVRVVGSETGEFTLGMNVSSGGETLDMVYPEVKVENGTEAVFDIPSVQTVLENPPKMTVISNGDTITVNARVWTRGAQVQEHLLCTSVDATGEPTNAVDEFSSDGKIFSWLKISDAMEGDGISWLFEGPNSVIVEAEYTADWSGEGSTWASFSLNDYKPKQIVGSWKVTVFVNEEEVLVDYFEVTKAESDGSIFTFILMFVVIPGALIFWWRRRSRTRRKKAKPVTVHPDYCVRCGAKLEPLAIFCSECGNRIEYLLQKEK